ncbi:hypothetical protein [Mitsuaria sp. GD03876]|uniref:hypothetical protein n=1 Tax=Mitsuaria sp. GD03876 TaxID=2975399 RepID=UPI00244CBF55|nr:hypothetical protein [Mitsuaria sp. GD03876]MDH0866758.1 hypothetical protein [Mitsuaria sp. GD03876]
MTSTLMPATRPHHAIARALLMAAMLLISLLSGTSAFARDDGQWQIMNARYGTAQRNMDVTDRLRELARRDDRVRVSNEFFGNDPAYGQTKTLRIYARSRDGQTRTFEFPEGSVIDGNDFTGWRGGEWGQGGGNGGWEGGGGGRDDGAYAILGARYGIPDASIDVTGRLRELARRDARVRVTNDLFRDDPAVGRTKTLRIFARDRANGQIRTFEYREGSWIDGSQFSGWGRGDWGQAGWNGGWDGRPGSGSGGGYNPGRDQLTIVRATYGSGLRSIDVTDRLRNISRGGSLDVRVDNDLAGRDPAYGESKTLRVVYRVGRGRDQSAEAREGDRMRLP